MNNMIIRTLKEKKKKRKTRIYSFIILIYSKVNFYVTFD